MSEVPPVRFRNRVSGRVRLQMVTNAATPSLTGFITANGDTRSPHVIDGGKTYTPLRCMGYRCPPKTQHDTGQELGRRTRVHRVFGNPRLGSTAHIMAWSPPPAGLPLANSPSALTHRWQRSQPCLDSAPSIRTQPTTSCTLRSQPDRQNAR